MMAEYPYDYILIVLFLIGTIIGVAHVFHDRQGFNSYKAAMPFLIGGMLFVVVSTVGNCAIEDHWDIEYIISFLSLRKVSEDWFFRHLNSWGYIFMSWGIAILLIVFRKTKHRHKGTQN